MSKEFVEAPRIYNLFPRLVGTISNWFAHLDRIEEMGFNWIYVNPLNYAGFSGSIYSIKENFRLNPMFSEDNEEDQYSWNSLKKFIERCHKRGLNFMIDFVINHTAIDSNLIQEHRSWFVEKWCLVEDGTSLVVKFFEKNQTPKNDEVPSDQYHLEKRIANPYAIDPSDSKQITIWGDLGEIDFDSPHKDEIVEYWKKLLDFYLNLGIDGLRCDAAYQVPSDVWDSLIKYVKSKNSNVLFIAETLGCTIPQCESIAKAGFDYIFNSSKYWDFTAPWCVEQFNLFRKYAPSIGFPESHDTTRLSKDSNCRVDIQQFRYFFTAFFSAGILMPIGYEYGFQRKLDVVDMMPKDWEPQKFDISVAIKEINKFKKQFECLNQDGRIIHFEYGDLNLLLIRKSNLQENEHMFLIYNKDWNISHKIYIPTLRYYLTSDAPILKLNLNGNSEEVKVMKLEQDLAPNEFLIYYQKKS